MQMASFMAVAGGPQIAYVRTPPQRITSGAARAGVMFCPGLLSHMQGTKALALESLVQRRLPSCSYLRFDYSGHGLSTGTFRGTTLADWFNDALLALDQLTDQEEPQIIVGSSMGGLIALHLAMRRPQRVAELVLVAPAVGFAERRWDAMSEESRQQLISGGTASLGSDYVDTGSDEVTIAFFEAARSFAIPEDVANLVKCPVRILHGAQDDVVPVQVSQQLVNRLDGCDAMLTVVQDGDHRLSAPKDLELLQAAVMDAYDRLQRKQQHQP